MAIGVAIIGSGIFARAEYLPAIQASKELELKAIYSRSLKSAEALANGTTGVDVYSEESGAGKGYADLLSRSDITAVAIVLPIPAQPEFIRKALTAGKHVISEKPIAKDIATAQELVQWYHANIDTNKTIWAVAENFRFIPKYVRMAEEVQKLGRVKNFRISVHQKVPMDSKYYLTSWRTVPDYQGGFVLDGGIHNVAGLRMILGSDPVVTLSAHSSLQQKYLPPIDTVDAVLKTKSGATGVFSLSYGSDFKDSVFEFSTEAGVVTLNDDKLTAQGQSEDIPWISGVAYELAAFGANIVKGGAVEKVQSPEEALADLEILEKMLKSGEGNGEKKDLTLQI